MSSFTFSALGLTMSPKIKDSIFEGEVLKSDWITPLMGLMSDTKLGAEVMALMPKINLRCSEITQDEINQLKTVNFAKQASSRSKKDLTRESFHYDAGWWTSIKSKWQGILSSLFNSKEDKELMSVYFNSTTSYSLGSRIRAKCGYFQQNLIGKILFEGLKWNPASKLSKGELILLQKEVLEDLGYQFNNDDSLESILQNLDSSAKKTFDTKFKTAKKASESEGFYSLEDSGKKAKIYRDNMVENLSKALDLYEFQVSHGLEIMYLIYLNLQEIFTKDSWSQSQLVMKPSKFKQDHFTAEDWDWLNNRSQDSVFGKERTVNFSIDKTKLDKVYQELKDSGTIYSKPCYNLDTKQHEVKDFDIEGLFALLMFLEESSDLGQGNLQTLTKSIGVKQVTMTNDNTLKNPPKNQNNTSLSK
jgi:hypothetical protein